MDFLVEGDAIAFARLIHRTLGGDLESFKRFRTSKIEQSDLFETIQEICQKYGVLLHIDEVVCGMGRTGKWFGYQHYGVKPDIVTMAKGVASGYAAISVTVTTEELFDEFKSSPQDPMSYFRDISTFGGCAGGPAAALENMRIIEEENLLEHVRHVSSLIRERCVVGPVERIQGAGFLLGLVCRIPARDVRDALLAQDILVGTSTDPNVVRLMPPLILPEQYVDALAQALAACGD